MDRKTVSIVGAIIVVGGLFAFAGDLDPPEGPIGPTMHTLDEIYAAVTANENCPPCISPPGMVAVHFQWTGGGDGHLTQQVPVPLKSNEVLVLTSWTSAGPAGCSNKYVLTEGPTPSVSAIRDILNGNVGSAHNVYPTGIRFPRAENGLANCYVTRSNGTCGEGPSFQGYITDGS